MPWFKRDTSKGRQGQLLPSSLAHLAESSRPKRWNFFDKLKVVERTCPTNRKGGTAQGGTAKMRSGTRVRRNGAFGARAQGFYIFDYRNKAFWYVSKPALIRIGYVSMCACVAFGSGSRRVPPSAVPPLRLFQTCTLQPEIIAKLILKTFFCVTAMRFSKKIIPKQFFHVILWITNAHVMCNFWEMNSPKIYSGNWNVIFREMNSEYQNLCMYGKMRGVPARWGDPARGIPTLLGPI